MSLPAEYRYEHYDPDDPEDFDYDDKGDEYNSMTEDEQFSSDATADYMSEDRYGRDESGEE